MKEENYELVFLPLFEMDLSEAVRYIANVLNSPTAAKKLVEETELAILERRKQPGGWNKSLNLPILVSGITFTQWLIGVFIRLLSSENNLINFEEVGLRTNF